MAVGLGSERYKIICRDVPTAVFFYGFPNSLPMTQCFEGSDEAQKKRELTALHDWMFGLLPRVAVEPRLTPELVARLDEGALEAVVGYLHAVGWIVDEDLEKQAAIEGAMGQAARRYQQSRGALAEEMLPVAAGETPRYADQHQPFTTDLAPNIRLAIREVAKRAHVRPSLLWRTPISEYLLDFRLLIQDEKAQGGGVLSGDDALIGFAR